MKMILDRLREPSTYAGLAALLASATFIPHAPDIAKTITIGGTFLSGILAIWLPEKKA
jgi:hypothetical protein